MMDDRDWEVPGIAPDPEAVTCGWRFHVFGEGPDWRCRLEPNHVEAGIAHCVFLDGLWFYVPPDGRLGHPDAQAGLGWAHVQFGANPAVTQLPELRATPDTARCVLDVRGESAYRGYAGEWARLLVTFAFTCDQQNRAFLAASFPEWVAAVWLYEQDPEQVRTLAMLPAGREGG